MLSWILFFGSCWEVRGALAVPFGIILEVLGVQMGCFLNDFGGLVASLGALGAQFAPGPPGAFQRRSLFSDFGVQREPKGGPKIEPKSIQTRPKTDANIDAIFEGPLERFWLTLGVLLGPWTLKMSVSRKRGAHFQKIIFFMLGLIFC